MSETSIEAAADAAKDEIAAASLSAASEAEARLDQAAEERDGALAGLSAHADARARIRRHADKAELRLAMRELAEGVRGMIRVAPLTAVLAGVATGVAIASRRRSRARQARPR